MRRTTHAYLGETRRKAVKQVAGTLDITVSELIRRAIDTYIGQRTGSGAYQYNLPATVIQETGHEQK